MVVVQTASRDVDAQKGRNQLNGLIGGFERAQVGGIGDDRGSRWGPNRWRCWPARAPSQCGRCPFDGIADVTWPQPTGACRRWRRDGDSPSLVEQ
jgi:hypothetical protein